MASKSDEENAMEVRRSEEGRGRSEWTHKARRAAGSRQTSDLALQTSAKLPSTPCATSSESQDPYPRRDIERANAASKRWFPLPGKTKEGRSASASATKWSREVELTAIRKFITSSLISTISSSSPSFISFSTTPSSRLLPPSPTLALARASAIWWSTKEWMVFRAFR